MKLIRNCPDCKKQILYKLKKYYDVAIKNNSKCKSCSILGHSVSKATRNKISKSNSGKSKHIDQYGEKNPRYGKSNYDIWLEKYGKEIADKKDKEKNIKIGLVNKGRKRIDICGDKNPAKQKDVRKKISNKMSGKNNPMYGKKPWNWNISIKNKTEFEKYKRDVWLITKKNKHLIENYNENIQGRAGIKGAHQIDHIVSIIFGYKNNISPEKIGHYINLQFIPWEENLLRRNIQRKMEKQTELKKIDFNKIYYMKRFGEKSTLKHQITEGKMQFIEYRENKKGVIIKMNDNNKYYLILNPENHLIRECGFIFKEL